MAQVLPPSLLTLFTAVELEDLVCGATEISPAALRSLVTYESSDSCSPQETELIIGWFWRLCEEDMTAEERSLLLRFVWGRSRLPRFASDLHERQFLIRVGFSSKFDHNSWVKRGGG